MSNAPKASESEHPTVLVAGGGIGGLCLALALNNHCGLAASDIEVFEQATAFTENAGGGIGLYANGLRVLRDISPDLLAAVRAAGYDYIFRRWLRHDGTEVACAREDELADEPELQSIGIRRWKLQKALFDAATAAGIVVHFKMRTETVESCADGRVKVSFADGTTRFARAVFGADGLKSKVREAVVGGTMAAEFTGVTCLMGSAKVPRPVRGICFPSSSTTKNHGCFYPTGDNETVFQLYFPAKNTEEQWGPMSPDEARKQCEELANSMEADGWDASFVAPVRAAETTIRVGIFSREPLDKWVDDSNRIILLGDAAHPPVPYIGQGAMMAMEDVGVLVHMLKHHCCAGGVAPFDPSDANLAAAVEGYQAMRIPRTKVVLGASHKLGATQQRRAESWLYNLWREYTIRMQVAVYGTLPVMKPGAAYDFARDVERRNSDSGSDEESSRSGSPKSLRAVVPDAAAKLGSRPLLAGLAFVAAAAAVPVIARRR